MSNKNESSHNQGLANYNLYACALTLAKAFIYIGYI